MSIVTSRSKQSGVQRVIHEGPLRDLIQRVTHEGPLGDLTNFFCGNVHPIPNLCHRTRALFGRPPNTHCRPVVRCSTPELPLHPPPEGLHRGVRSTVLFVSRDAPFTTSGRGAGSKGNGRGPRRGRGPRTVFMVLDDSCEQTFI